MRPFVDLRWWPFALLVALAVALMLLAAALESRRQFDDGNIPSTGERPNAHSIRSVVGLHMTLQRGQTIGWSVGLFLAGLAFGSMTKSLLDAAQGNDLIQRVLAVQGTDGVYTTMTQFLAAAATAYVVSAVVRLFNDEQSGLGEAVLAGAVSRWRWLFSAVAAALVGSTVLMFWAGLGNGLGAGITLGEAGTVWRLTLAGLAFVPAMAVIAGVAALAIALRHPWIGWLAVTFVVTSLYLGALLRLPRWLIDASPVGRTTVPTSVPVTALAVMAVVAAALILVAGWIYRNRDAV
jgi:ABC-2 type transport system permease protein